MAKAPDKRLAAAKAMIKYLEVKDFHIFEGDCPDPNQKDSRDKNCPMCKQMNKFAKVFGLPVPKFAKPEPDYPGAW